MIKKRIGDVVMIAETPKATSVVCTIHPEIRPAVVASPEARPLTTLCVNTYILSGPGENANKAVAPKNVIIDSIIM